MSEEMSRSRLAALKDGDIVGCVMADGITYEGYVVPEGLRFDAVRVMCRFGYWVYYRSTGVLKSDAHLDNPRRIVELPAHEPKESP